jgi:hypothetical protein
MQKVRECLLGGSGNHGLSMQLPVLDPSGNLPGCHKSHLAFRFKFP